MLTRELAIAVYERGEVLADRLVRPQHAHYESLAQRMLDIYGQGKGVRRQELHRQVHELFRNEALCPPRRPAAFCKLLDEVSLFDQSARRRAAALRQKLFHLAAPYHPLVASPDTIFESAEADIKDRLAAGLGKPWGEIEQELFADVISEQRLRQFDGYPNSLALLARYNVAQAQAVLYAAESMSVVASRDLKTILRYSKLARLMHVLNRGSDGTWRMEFSGPASSLRSTRRYGVQMAKFLPALIACRDWQMRAVIVSANGQWRNTFCLASSDGLHSSLPEPAEFDSSLEKRFANEWGDGPRDGWTMTRESEVLHEGQRTFIPDFVFRNVDGRVALLEIAGYWTPEYLAAKRETLQRFGDQGVLLAVPEKLLHSPGEHWIRSFPGLITYKNPNHLPVTAVLKRLAGIPRSMARS